MLKLNYWPHDISKFCHCTLIPFSGQFLPASERCDDPLLAVLESPSTVHLLLDQMFMHIKCSSSKSESDKSNSSGEVNSVNSSASSKEDNMQSSSNENDAGGGNYIFTIICYNWH